MSSNLISRSTVNAFTKSFLLQLILDTRIWVSRIFFLLYWKFSPCTDLEYVNTYAWYVIPSGGLDDYYSGVTLSYGNFIL